MQAEFVNRKKEYVLFKEWIYKDSFSGKAAGIFLYSKSGIGKSRFINHVLEYEFDDFIKINIEIHSNNTNAIDSLTFYRLLYRALIQKTEPDGKLPLLQRFSIGKTLSISEIVGIELSLSDSRGYDDDTLKMVNYIHKKLRLGKEKYIIVFQNFHLVDSESLELLRDVFEADSKNRFVFEYTISNSTGTMEMARLHNYTSNFLECDVFELKSLKVADVQILCECSKIPFSAASQLYIAEDGNLFPIVMLKNAPNQFSTNPLLDIVKTLQADHRFVLYIFYFCKGSLDIRELFEILQNDGELLAGNPKYTDKFIEQLIEYLCVKGLIRINQSMLSVVQDQVLDVLNITQKESLFFLAGEFVAKHYHRKLTSQINHETVALKLLYVYSLLPNLEVINLFSPLCEVVQNQKYPQQIINKVKQIRENVIMSSDNTQWIRRLTKGIADICIAAGNWEAAYDSIQDVFSHNIPQEACYIAAIQSNMVDDPQTENILFDLLNTHRNNEKAHISICLSLLSFYMRTKPQDEALAFANCLISHFPNDGSLSYAFLLKNRSNFLDNTQALDSLHDCVMIFEKHGRKDLVAMTAITIASRYVYSGSPDLALDLINKTEADAITLGTPIRRYYFYNNRSALHLLLGIYTEQTEQELKFASLLCSSLFEKAIILCNLMIYYLKTQQFELARITFIDIESLNLEGYRNSDLELIILQNKWYYFIETNQRRSARNTEIEIARFFNSSSCPDDIQNHLLNYFPRLLSSKRCQGTYMSQFREHPEFIGYWQYEVTYDDFAKPN